MVISLLYEIILNKREKYRYGDYYSILDELSRATVVAEDILRALALNQPVKEWLIDRDINSICRYFEIDKRDLFFYLPINNKYPCYYDETDFEPNKDDFYYTDCHIDIFYDRINEVASMLFPAEIHIGGRKINSVCHLTEDFAEIHPRENIDDRTRNFLTALTLNKEIRDSVVYALENEFTESTWYWENLHYSDCIISLHPCGDHPEFLDSAVLY